MKISVKNGKACEKILKIEVDPSQVKKEYEAFYTAIAPKSKVPGFRPGKAPRPVLAMHYQEEAKKNVLNQLIQDTYREALKEEALDPIGYPEVDEVDFDQDKLSYRIQLEVRPKIKLSKVAGLQVKREKLEVKPEEIEESLKRLQKTQAQYKTIDDRAARKEDYLVIDYVCMAGDKKIDERKDDWIQIREDEYLKGFSTKLVGLKAGDEKDIEVTLPEKFWNKDVQGKPATFSVNVKELKSEILPEINDELAKSAGDFNSLAELKEKIEKEILIAKEKKMETDYEKSLLDELVKHNKFTLPEKLVARRLERLVHDSLNRYEQNGFPKEKLDEIKKDLEKDLEDEARRQIQLAFLLDEIAEKEKLTALEEDIEARYKDLAAQVRQGVEAVRQYYAENENARLGLMEQIRSEKAIQFLKQNAKNK